VIEVALKSPGELQQALVDEIAAVVFTSTFSTIAGTRTFYFVRVISDRWASCEARVAIKFTQFHIEHNASPFLQIPSDSYFTAPIDCFLRPVGSIFVSSLQNIDGGQTIH
jgi:hypothetical protein